MHLGSLRRTNNKHMNTPVPAEAGEHRLSAVINKSPTNLRHAHVAGQAQPYVSEGVRAEQTAQEKMPLACFAARKNPAASQESYLIRCLAPWHQIIVRLHPISSTPMPAKLGATAAWKPEYGRYPYCGVFSMVVFCVLFFLCFPSAWVWIMLLSPENTKSPLAWAACRFDAGPAGCAAAGGGGFETPRFGITIHGTG